MRSEERRAKARGQRRRRARAWSYPLQLAAATSLTALAAWIVVMVLIKAARPYWLGHDVEKKVAVLRTEVEERKTKIAEMRARIEYLHSPEGMEATARRAGWRRPGETVYFLRETPGTEAGAAPAREEQ